MSLRERLEDQRAGREEDFKNDLAFMVTMILAVNVVGFLVVIGLLIFRR